LAAKAFRLPNIPGRPSKISLGPWASHQDRHNFKCRLRKSSEPPPRALAK